MPAESEDGSVGPLREALMACAASGMSGALRITGDPGGTIRLTDGLVTGIETPGSPTPEVLLLRSRRVTGPRWDAAFSAAAAADRPLSAELIARDLIGAGELEALLRTALADAIFVLASGTTEECLAELGSPSAILALNPGAEPAGLLAEASRRIRVLASLPLPATYRKERLIVAPRVRPGVRVGDGQDEILTLADGRRTPRDLAFTLGHGVYATMLRLAQMQEAGLLVTGSVQAVSRPARPAVRPASGPEPEPGDALPQRGKSSPGLPRRTAPGQAREARTPLNLLRPRSGRDTSPG